MKSTYSEHNLNLFAQKVYEKNSWTISETLICLFDRNKLVKSNQWTESILLCIN